MAKSTRLSPEKKWVYFTDPEGTIIVQQFSDTLEREGDADWKVSENAESKIEAFSRSRRFRRFGFLSTAKTAEEAIEQARILEMPTLNNAKGI